MNELKVKELDYSSYFSLEGKVKKIEGEQVQVLGMSFKKLGDDSLDEQVVDKFLRKCKQVVESDVFKGCLVAPVYLNLVNFDIKFNRMVYDDGSIAITTPFSKEDTRITEKKDIEFRKALFFYIYTDLTKDELNEKFNGDFLLEGEIPKN